MKKLLALALVGAFAGTFVMAAMAANEPVKIAKVSGIKIDGKIDDWSAVKPINVAGDDYAADAAAVADNSFAFYGGYDAKCLYVAFDVITPVVSFWQDMGSVWNQTGLEIFLGGAQWGFGNDADGNGAFASWKDGGKECKVTRTAKGFICEASFDMAFINDNYADAVGATLAPGAEFQFSFGVDMTDTEGGTRTGQLYYPIDWAWNQVDTFATATLVK